MAKFSPAAQVTRGALVAYLRPRLAQDHRPHCFAMVNKAVEGLTSRNFNSRQGNVVNALRRYTQGRLAQDTGIEDLAALLGALAPEAQMADQAPGMGQIASNPGGSAGSTPMGAPAGSTDQPGGPPGAGGGAGGGIIDLIVKYLTEEGVAPEILNNIPAIVSQAGAGGGDGGSGMPGGMDSIIPRVQPGMDQEEIEGEPGGQSLRVMEPRGGASSEFRPESADAALDNEGHAGHDPWAEATGDEAEDDEVPDEQSEQMGGVAQVSSSGTPSRVVNGGANDANRPVSKAAMDHAIRIAQDAAIRNQRAIRDAERFCRPWVGDIAMDANHPADVYRATLKAIGVKDTDKLHPDALRPILEAQPRPGARQMYERHHNGQRPGMAQDSAVEVKGSFAERFPDAMRITTMS